ncbi:MAG: hypothetical protein M1838_006180, partial [Thelocarpon superellum]
MCNYSLTFFPECGHMETVLSSLCARGATFSTPVEERAPVDGPGMVVCGGRGPSCPSSPPSLAVAASADASAPPSSSRGGCGDRHPPAFALDPRAPDFVPGASPPAADEPAELAAPPPPSEPESVASVDDDDGGYYSRWRVVIQPDLPTIWEETEEELAVALRPAPPRLSAAPAAPYALQVVRAAPAPVKSWADYLEDDDEEEAYALDALRLQMVREESSGPALAAAAAVASPEAVRAVRAGPSFAAILKAAGVAAASAPPPSPPTPSELIPDASRPRASRLPRLVALRGARRQGGVASTATAAALEVAVGSTPPPPSGSSSSSKTTKKAPTTGRAPVLATAARAAAREAARRQRLQGGDGAGVGLEREGAVGPAKAPLGGSVLSLRGGLGAARAGRGDGEPGHSTARRARSTRTRDRSRARAQAWREGRAQRGPLEGTTGPAPALGVAEEDGAAAEAAEEEEGSQGASLSHSLPLATVRRRLVTTEGPSCGIVTVVSRGE